MVKKQTHITTTVSYLCVTDLDFARIVQLFLKDLYCLAQAPMNFGSSSPHSFLLTSKLNNNFYKLDAAAPSSLFEGAVMPY